MKSCLACEIPFESHEWACPSCGHAPKRNGHLQFAPDLADASAGFDAASFALLEQVEESSFWFRSRNELIVWALESYFPAAHSMLEVGCGTGYVLSEVRRRIPALRVAGSEIFVAGLEVAARRLPDAELFQMDARHIPFDGEFDVIGAFDVLEHIEEDEQVVAQLHKALRPGGGVIITVPQHPALWSAVDDFSRHRRRYSRRELVGKLERAGFTIVRATSFMSLLLPPLMGSRLLHRRRKATAFDPRSEYRLPPLADRMFERVLAVERHMIRRGISLPAGGSLLVVAERR